MLCVWKVLHVINKSQVNSFLRGNFKNVVSFDQINVQTVQLIHNKHVLICLSAKCNFTAESRKLFFVNDYTAQS